MKGYLALAAAGLLLVVGCSDSRGPRLDGSSDEAFRASVKQVGDSLDSEGKAKFEKSLRVLVFADVESPAEMFKMMSSPGAVEAAQSRIRGQLDGKTAGQVVAEADAVNAKRDASKGPKK